MITIGILLTILTGLALSSCATKRTICHEIHYIPSYGATAPQDERSDVINPNMPYCPKGQKKSPEGLYDDTNSSTEYKNKRQYPQRGMSRGDSD